MLAAWHLELTPPSGYFRYVVVDIRSFIMKASYSYTGYTAFLLYLSTWSNDDEGKYCILIIYAAYFGKLPVGGRSSIACNKNVITRNYTDH